MIALKNISIRPKLTAMFLLIGLIPLALAGWFSTQQTREALLAKSFAQLETIQASKKIRIETYLTERKSDLGVFSTDGFGIDAFTHFDSIFHDFENNRQGIGHAAWEKLLNKKYVNWIEQFKKEYGYYDIMFIDLEGNIIYTVNREADLGSNVITGSLKNSPVGKIFSLAQHGVALTDFELYAPSNFQHAAFVGVPFQNEGKSLGVFVFQLPTKDIDSIMESRVGMGKSGETYLVGKLNGTISYRSDRSFQGGKIGQTVAAPYIEKALAGESGHEISYSVSEATEKMISYKPLQIAGLNWAIVGSINLDEVEEPIREQTKFTLILAAILSTLVVGGAFVVARGFSNPLQAVNDAADKIAAGDWTTRVTLDRSDELGKLADSFNRMARSNQDQFWVKSSLADLTGIIQTSDTLETFASDLIRKLCPLLDCAHGVVYVLDDETKNYKLLGTYGFKERKNLSNVFATGEGLIGQCALERQPILLTDVPGDHIMISTGLGASTPLTLIAIPLIFQDHVLAVVELGSFHRFTDSQKNLLDELIPTLGLGLENHKRNQRTLVLLEQTQAQASELEMQSEELHRSNAELQVQSEEMHRTNEELEEQSQSLLASQDELRVQQSGLEQANEELEAARLEVERKAADLEAASRYKSQFIANMSHELRTPLNSLLILAKGFADNEEGNLTERQVEGARIILGSGTDLLELINDILNLSKIESGKMDITVTEMDVADYADEIRTQFRHMAKNKGLEWRVTVDSGAPEQIYTDVGKLRQIVKNFLSNAFKFTQQGEVSVNFHPKDAANPGGWLAISVADNGIGIPLDKQKMIFEAFQQADGSTSRKYGGTGLGLSISLELARLLGGEIQLESIEGKGSVFTLLLPIRSSGPREVDSITSSPSTSGTASGTASASPAKSPATTAKPAPAATTAATATSITPFISDDRAAAAEGDRFLLVIEDDPIFAGIVRDLARKNGYKCITAATGESGIALAIHHRPVGIILDRGLPDMDGYLVLERLKKNPATQRIPVHIISAMDRDTGLEKGAIGVLEKPVTKDQLRTVMGMFECPTPDQRRKLLLVEDDPTARKVTANYLESDGIHVVTAGNCRDAMQLLRDEKFHCMILDLGLPDCSGFQLLERITMDPSIQGPPVVIHSGKALSRVEYNQLHQYTDSFVIKGTPLSGEQLADEVASFLDDIDVTSLDARPVSGMISPDWNLIFKDITVLLVDDDVRNTFALSGALEKKGLGVIMAPDGMTALHLLEHSPKMINAVLMDVMMPGMDGNEITRQIRKRRNSLGLPIIGLSAKAMEEDRERSMEAGMNAFLPKPVNIDRLLFMLQDHVKGAQDAT